MKKIAIAIMAVILMTGIAATAFIIGCNHKGYTTVNFGDGEIAISDLVSKED